MQAAPEANPFGPFGGGLGSFGGSLCSGGGRAGRFQTLGLRAGTEDFLGEEVVCGLQIAENLALALQIEIK